MAVVATPVPLNASAQEVRPASRDRYRLGGLVYDSMARAPLVGAFVQILLMRAIAAGDSGGVLEVEVPHDGLLMRDVYLAPLGTAAPGPSSALRGIVRDASASR